MKLSLAWIFDHIDVDWKSIDTNTLVTKFNQVTAEIEDFYRINYDMATFFIAWGNKNGTSFFIPELNQDVTLSDRTESGDMIAKGLETVAFMVKKEEALFRWATLADFGVEKDGFVPALDIHQDDVNGGWRRYFEHEDVILEVDNKSITHRPDMWGHRGFAREIAAFLDLPFKSKGNFLASHRVVSFAKASTPTNTNPFVIENQVPDLCYKFNGLYFPSIENKPSNVLILSRLLKVGSRPINSIVDLTNYVTLDWSQPVHAYDAAKVTDRKIIIRTAQPKEKLLLLDGNELSLSVEDVVIADSEKPMCLAGIKGGYYDSVTAETDSIFFEAANFDAGSVRKAAQRHKTRTDSSARFEKTLDQNQALEAVLRFVELAHQCGVSMTMSSEIISLGKDKVEPMIRVTHSFLEGRLGLSIEQDEVLSLLKRLEFSIELDKQEDGTAYLITVPSFRASKDVKIKEDILEEVARSYGFNKIKLELPQIPRTPYDLTALKRSRMITHYFAYGANMMEQQNYNCYDEQFLQEFDMHLSSPVSIVNPVTENFRRLVVTLIPSLLKNIIDNLVHRDVLYFFEMGKTWHSTNKKEVLERKEVSGIFFEKRKDVDFYEGKYRINALFSMLGFAEKDVIWEQMKTSLRPWYKPYQAASLYYNDTLLGYAGVMDKPFLSRFPVLPESSAFVFELNGDALLNINAVEKHFVPFSRYQDTYFDLSLMVPISVSTISIEKALKDVSPLICSVELIDFFEKDEWVDVRSLTFRIHVSNKDKTLEKEQIDTVMHQAIAAVESEGVSVRSQE